MPENVCSQCGAPLAPGATSCKYCGEAVQQPIMPSNTQQVYQTPAPVQQNIYVQSSNDGVDPSWPIKNKTTAGILAIILGGLGVHKFYLGKTGLGILYLLFCLTCVPEILGIIEGIIYLTSDEHNFQVKNKVRTS